MAKSSISNVAQASRTRGAAPIRILIVVLSFIVFCFCGSICALTAEAQNSDILVGAIRWDFWTPDSPRVESVVDPLHAGDRTPFFAYTKPDGKEGLLGGLTTTMDAEDAYAYSAGIDYWIFGYYIDTGTYGRSVADARKLDLALKTFAALPDRRGMRFTILIDQNSPVSDLEPLVQMLTKHTSDRDYLKLADGSAPVFVQDIRGWEKSLGPDDKVIAFFREMMEEVRKRSGVTIRFILMGSPPDTRKKYIRPGTPFDVFTVYAVPPPADHKAHSFEDCADYNRKTWRDDFSLGLPFLPTVSMGWDYRPELFYPAISQARQPDPSYCQGGSDAEYRALLQDAVAVAEHSSADFPLKSVVLYAWNELTEGGWIIPTLKGGAHRLALVASALGRSREPHRFDLRFPFDRGHEWPCPPGMMASPAKTAQPPADAPETTTRWMTRTCG